MQSAVVQGSALMAPDWITRGRLWRAQRCFTAGWGYDYKSTEKKLLSRATVAQILSVCSQNASPASLCWKTYRFCCVRWLLFVVFLCWSTNYCRRDKHNFDRWLGNEKVCLIFYVRKKLRYILYRKSYSWPYGKTTVFVLTFFIFTLIKYLDSNSTYITEHNNHSHM